MATRWLDPVQAAKRLGVSQSTVWRMLRRGLLPSHKAGGRRLIAAADVARARDRAEQADDPSSFPAITLDQWVFRMAGKFRSDGEGPGASDKHHYLGVKR